MFINCRALITKRWTYFNQRLPPVTAAPKVSNHSGFSYLFSTY